MSRVGKGDFYSRRSMLAMSVQRNNFNEIKFEDHPDYKRQSGRSLARAFGIIHTSMAKPNTWVSVSDHNENGNRNLLAILFNIIEELSLEGFYYNKRNNEITFDLKMIYRENWRSHGLTLVE